MGPKLETFLEFVQQAKTLEDLRRLLHFLRDFYGVDHLIYHPLNTLPEEYILLTYSTDWVTQYLESNYARIDPVVQGCFSRFGPVQWKTLDWSAKSSRNFLAEAILGGVGNQGLSVPIRGPKGQFAMFTVNHRCSDRDWQLFSAQFQRDLILIAYYLNSKAMEIAKGRENAAGQSLSPREIDALTLLALGYSRALAAENLRISENTLRSYIEAARFKLGTANTTHAVATALSRGLIVV